MVSPPGAEGAPAVVTAVGEEERCGEFEGSRPSIAIDTAGLPHIVIDQGISSKIYTAYPEMGSDTNHPAIGIDLVRPQVCYISITYAPGVVVNVWDGGEMVFDAGLLPVVDPDGSSGSDRFGPQWAPARGAGGGAFLAWQRGGRVKLAYVSPGGAVSDPFPGKADPRDVCEGTRPALATDAAGGLHLAYVRDGMRYRKLSVEYGVEEEPDGEGAEEPAETAPEPADATVEEPGGTDAREADAPGDAGEGGPPDAGPDGGALVQSGGCACALVVR